MGVAKLLWVLLIGLLPNPAVAAAATWSQPVDVSSPSLFVDNPFIEFGSSGIGFASWRWQDGVGNQATSGLRFSTRAASGAFSRERAAPNAVVPPVVYGRDRVLFLTEESVRTRRRNRERIGIAFGRIGRVIDRRRTIDTVETFRLPAVAANDSGRVAAAYVRSVRGTHRVAKLAVGSSRRFARPRVVSSGGVNAVTTAVGPRGDVVVAWERNGHVEARIARPGHRLGRVVRVGNGVKLGTKLRAAVAPNGRVWIAWTSQLLTEGGDNGPFSIQVAVKAVNRSRFRAPQRLDRYERRAHDEANFDIALDRHGNGFLAWTTFDGKSFRARFAHATRAGAFLGFTDLSRPGYDAVVGDLATSPSTDEEIVLWSMLDAVGEVGTTVLAGHLQGGDNYGGEEKVSLGDRARKPAVAFDPKSGLPTVVWSQREGPDGPGIPVAQVRTFLRASTRSP